MFRSHLTRMLVLLPLILSPGLLIQAAGDDGTPVAGPVVFVGAGDIASCYDDNDEATARLLDGIEGTVFTLGDNAYDSGSAHSFGFCYDPTWGRHRERTRPTPGNHDYYTPGAEGYFLYFGEAAGDPARGYYAYDLGAWRIIALNTNCTEVDGCGEGSAQMDWLAAELAANPARCTLAYGHHPMYSSGKHGDEVGLTAMWDLLDRAGVDVMLGGHDHIYERFAPQDAWGNADPEGMRQFVVGTGGAPLYEVGQHQNSEASSDEAFGVLKLTLHEDQYDWEFVPIEGMSFTDAGSATCS
jgi:3',5'-cyclic AMP phosphodiesterase CpdA